jgi:uncharacterized protein DUF6152
MKDKLLLIAILIGVAVMPLMAHHSFAAFDMANSKSIAGTVKQVDWTNPHIWIWIDVPNEKGGVDTYGFEGMSPNYLARRGWERTTLKAGDKITVSYRPMKDGSHGGMFINGKTPAGKVLTMGGAGDGEPNR